MTLSDARARALRSPYRPQGDWRRGAAQLLGGQRRDGRRGRDRLRRAIQYLAAAGIGRLRVIDDDAVELDNLQRQSCSAPTTSAAPRRRGETRSSRLNPDVAFRRPRERLDHRQCRRPARGRRPGPRRLGQFRDPADRLGRLHRGAHPARLRRHRPVPGADRHCSAAGRRTSPAIAASSATLSTPRIATAAPSSACSGRWPAWPAASRLWRRSARRGHRRGRRRQAVAARRGGAQLAGGDEFAKDPAGRDLRRRG